VDFADSALEAPTHPAVSGAARVHIPNLHPLFHPVARLAGGLISGHHRTVQPSLLRTAHPLMSRLRAIALLCLLCLAPDMVGAAASARTEHLEASLLADHRSVRTGDRIWVGLRFDIIPHWHVYWRNPGDSGTAPRIRWRLPEGWEAGEIRWPVPARIPVGPFVNYGYERSVTLMVPIRVGPVEAGRTLALEADARWLVCREECIPEEAVLDLGLEGATAASEPDSEAAAHFERVRSRWPVALEAPARYAVADGRVRLTVEGLDWTGGRIADLWLAANDWGPVAPSGEQTWEIDDDRLRLDAPAGDIPPDGRSPLAGLLVLSEHSGEETLVRGFTLEAPPGRPGEGPAPVGPGLLAALGLALVGGLVLNLMPCVLPVLSIKVMGFVGEARGTRRRLALHGLLFGAGVLASVLVLAGVLVALRAGGQSLGWGFQLQSPVVVTLLAYLMLLVGLGLSGVLSVGQGLMGMGQEAAGRGGAAGAFWTGVLAVVVASPCTAPFMGAALGFALTRPAAEALAVFLALGAGFSLPVVALSLWPAWVRLVPRPGPWMGRLQQLLAFPMYGAAAWLIWVLSQQTDPGGLAAALAGLVALALAAWLYAQRTAMPRVAAGLGGLALAGALVAVAGTRPGAPGATGSSTPVEVWSPQRVETLRAAGRPVLVNFTAAWCITCKVNERLALTTPAVIRAMDSKEIAYLKGDWTRRDPLITEELARFQRSGVPLYLLYAPGAASPEVLPQLLTEGTILAAFDRL
jgi:thiol:disulfide interchange protein DsbD